MAGYAGQSQAARNQQSYANRRYNEVAKSSMESYRFTLNQLETRRGQEIEAAQQQGTQNAVEAARARSSQIASAGAGGVTGNSVEALLDEFNFIESGNSAMINRNLRWKSNEIDSQAVGARSEAQSRINSVAPQQLENPSLLALMLSLGAVGTQGLVSYAAGSPTRRQTTV